MRANTPDDRPATKADIQDLKDRLSDAFSNIVARDFEPIKAELAALRADVGAVKGDIARFRQLVDRDEGLENA